MKEQKGKKRHRNGAHDGASSLNAHAFFLCALKKKTHITKSSLVIILMSSFKIKEGPEEDSLGKVCVLQSGQMFCPGQSVAI